MESETVERKIVITGSGGRLGEGTWENVPPFAIITGENGSGKSQLLHALGKAHNVQVDQPQGRHNMQSTPPYNGASVFLHGPALPNGSVFYSPSAWTLRTGTVASEESVNQRINELYSRPAQTLTTQPRPEWREDPAYVAFVVDDSENGKRITSQPSLEEFRNGLTPLHIAAPAFHSPTQFDLALYFFAYELLAANLRTKSVSEEEIEKRFGEKPWLLLNEILSASGLEFRVAPPSPVTASVFSTQRHYQLQFVDDERGASFSFEHLSSGEKVIVSTLLWRLAAESAGSHFQLLLLDEPDAHLHPSMAKRFLSVIENVFVKERGVAVIMTTHSPTTVALAPEDSIFILEKNAGGIPVKAGKDEALRRLTTGVPTLSVAQEHRRQVFVEAPADALFYEQIYLAHREKFASDVSLHFIAVGERKGGGCDNVIRIVKGLVDAGNPWVYGLLDRDVDREATDRIRVAGDKHSVENYLYDPIALAIHLARLDISKDDGFSRLFSYPYWEIFSRPTDDLDRLSTFISDKLIDTMTQMNAKLTHGSATKVERENHEQIVTWASRIFSVDNGKFSWTGDDVKVSYAGGVTVSQASWLSEIRGHDLEYVCREAFQELKSHKNSPAGDMRERHLRDLPAMAPADILSSLLAIERHAYHVGEDA
ncbi:AAA family ATPase [Paraburkholderia tropica]|uniref:AAA family ATPase n=1 Tax=Paraburkholderia tropica TaxID=92647 RepID=UPI002AB6BDC3|nr:ATP-binding protein [Paraburkholderia tropica]